MKGNISIKAGPREFKDIDVKNRVVSGYLSHFGNVDYDGDIIEFGAFKKTIAERGPKGTDQIKFCFQHDMWGGLIGAFKELEEDNTGLRYVAQFADGDAVPKAKEAIGLIEVGALKEHSIGFKTINDEKDGDINRIKEVFLFEGSLVTLGANPLTPVTGLKSLNDDQISTQLQFINEKMDTFTKALSIDLTKATRETVEFELGKVKNAYNDLFQEMKARAAQSEALKQEETIDWEKAFNELKFEF